MYEMSFSVFGSGPPAWFLDRPEMPRAIAKRGGPERDIVSRRRPFFVKISGITVRGSGLVRPHHFSPPAAYGWRRVGAEAGDLPEGFPPVPEMMPTSFSTMPFRPPDRGDNSSGDGSDSPALAVFCRVTSSIRVAAAFS
ncbi:MAG: hypothetical protein LBE84_02760 [Planctomycetota bacterium]|nr:hypothetical protein [Planctomycetota bacterium]